MKFDIILAGVGGQGVLSVAAIIAQAAVNDGFEVRQSEVHGMAQRGGAVLAHLRISDGIIASDLVPKGGADLILSMEPLESLRYIQWLSPTGTLVSAADPLVNIGNYPELSQILETIKALPRQRIIEAAALAKEAGLSKAVNAVMAGAVSPFLPVGPDALQNAISAIFSSKGETVIAANVSAFQMGRKAAQDQSELK